MSLFDAVLDVVGELFDFFGGGRGATAPTAPIQRADTGEPQVGPEEMTAAPKEPGSGRQREEA